MHCLALQAVGIQERLPSINLGAAPSCMQMQMCKVVVAVSAICLTSPALAQSAGVASMYGYSHHGKRTASGERFNMHGLTAAHRTLPFGTRVKVCREACVIVRINDRGPFVRGRSIDLSGAAAKAIGVAGLAKVTMLIEQSQ